MCIQSTTFAQNPTQTARENYVKDLYQYYQSRIKRGKYYLNEYKINANSLQWQNKSNLQKTEKYFYSYTGDAKPILRLISVIIESGSKKLEKKFVFDQNEKMVLCIEEQNQEDKYPYRQLKAYFSEKEELVMIRHDRTYIPYTSLDQNPRLIELQKESKKLVEKFNLHFLEIEKKTGN